MTRDMVDSLVDRAEAAGSSHSPIRGPGSDPDPYSDPEDLRALLRGSGSLAIVCHDNPDPDCLASALALDRIAESVGVSTVTTVYGGAITHQQNRAMVNVLDLDIEPFEDDSLEGYDLVGFVDHAVPGRNNRLSTERGVDIVIDHHETEPSEAAYVDHRPTVGATATIMVEYLRELDLDPDERLWTALAFGIRRETLGFQRGTTRAEHAAARYLHPHVDTDIVRELENTLFTTGTLDAIGRAITDREIRGSWLVANAGRTDERDAIPQAADYLLNLEGMDTTVVFAVVGDAMQLSARSRDPRVHVGDWLEATVGNDGSAGGHRSMAGGRVPLDTFVTNGEVREDVADLAGRALSRRLFDSIEERS